MPTYEFVCHGCSAATAPKGKQAVCHHQIDMPMKDAPSCGQRVPCPAQGCPGMVTRVLSLTNVIVKGGDGVEWKPNETVMTRIGGEDIPITFVDHPHTDPALRRNLANIGAKPGAKPGKSVGGLSKAYYSPKHKGLCVDVVSNVRDPLGRIEKNKRDMGIETTPTVHKVNQNYQKRGKK